VHPDSPHKEHPCILLHSYTPKGKNQNFLNVADSFIACLVSFLSRRNVKARHFSCFLMPEMACDPVLDGSVIGMFSKL
jgi:hypothetical protein